MTPNERLRHLLRRSRRLPLPPLQHAECAEGIPAARRPDAFQFKVGLALVGVLQWPAAVFAAAAAHDVNRFGKAFVLRRVDGPARK